MKRIIADKLEKFIDARVGPKLKLPYAETQVSFLHINALLAMVGIHEEGGDNRGELVNAIQASVGDGDGAAWCMALQQAAIAYVEKKKSIQSPLTCGDNCVAVYNQNPGLRVAIPEVGDLIIWRHQSTSEGHTGGIVIGGDSVVQTVEGNTSDSRSLDREGDGCYQKIRSLSGGPVLQVLGFLRPFPQ